MPITVKHDMDGGIVGDAANRIGYAQGKERSYVRDAEESLKSRQLDIQQNAIIANSMNEFMQNGTRFGLAAMASADRDADRKMAKELQESAPARALVMGQVQQQLQKENFKWQYTESQRRDIEKTTEGISWVRGQVASGKWTPQQGEQAEEQLWNQFHSILPMPQYDDSPSIEQQVKASLYTTDDGITFYRKSDGSIAPLPASAKESKKQPSATEFVKFYQMGVDKFTTTDDDGNETTDFTKAEAFANKAMEAYQRFSGVQIPGQQPQPQAVPPQSPQAKVPQQYEPENVYNPEAPAHLRRQFIIEDVKTGGKNTSPVELSKTYLELAREQSPKSTIKQIKALAIKLMQQDGVAEIQ